MNPVRNWKRLMAVGCSHGSLADPDATERAIDFASRWGPRLVIHLGDFVDLACFRSGAAGTADESVDPEDDIASGLTFVHRMFTASRKTEKRLLFCGNHEDRIWQLAKHPRKIIATAAAHGVCEIMDVAKEHKAELVEYDINERRQFGDTQFLHGFMYNESFLRDHAETFGKCVIAHGHKAGVATARRSDHAVGYCVGTLSNIPAMRYAKTKRARLSWSQGWVYGEYCDDQTVLWLIERAQNHEWRLPL